MSGGGGILEKNLYTILASVEMASRITLACANHLSHFSMSASQMAS